MYKNVKSTSLIFTIAIAMLISSFNVSGQFSKARLHPNCLKIEPTTHLSAEWVRKEFSLFTCDLNGHEYLITSFLPRF